MSYFAFGVMSCMFCTFDMSGKGASGPSSTILCLPTSPQRGITVLSSVSVAQVWTRLRGPTVARNSSLVREGIPVGVRHRVEVVEVAEELVEAVHRRQELVEVAEVVLAELAGRVALRLQGGGDRRGLGRHADVGAGLADGGHAGADRQLAGDEVGAAGGAARLRVVVGEQHAFGGELVEVRRLSRHDAAAVGADVEPADIVAHDDEDVRLLGVLGEGGRSRRESGDRHPEHEASKVRQAASLPACAVSDSRWQSH